MVPCGGRNEQPGDSEQSQEEQREPASDPSSNEEPGEGEGAAPEERLRTGPPGPAPPPDLEKTADEKSMESAEEFDQLGEEIDSEASSTGEESRPDASETPTSPIMEQWLEQVEGDPRQLLRNKFILEEQRLIQSRRAPFRESRPW